MGLLQLDEVYTLAHVHLALILSIELMMPWNSAVLKALRKIKLLAIPQSSFQNVAWPFLPDQERGNIALYIVPIWMHMYRYKVGGTVEAL